MIQTLTELYSQFLAFSSKNPVVGGMIGIWFLSVITFMLRNTPRMLMKGFMNTFTTTFNLNNAGWEYNTLLYPRIISWFMSTQYSSFSRSLSPGELARVGKDTYPTVAAGYGRHLFFYQGRPFILMMQIMDSSGSERIKESVRLVMLGRNQKVIADLIKEAWEFKPEITEQEIYRWDEVWCCPTVLQQRSLKQVFVHQEIKDYIVNRIREFQNDRQWYVDNGITYKMNIMLEGPPGTGKTSLIKAVATELKLNICKFEICDIEDHEIRKMLDGLEGRLGLLEDIHSCDALLIKTPQPDDHAKAFTMKSLSLTGFLNAIDGIESHDGNILFATTNYIERLDDAVFRRGRFDLRIYIGMMDRGLVQEFIQQMYGDQSPWLANSVPENVSLPGCDVYGIFFDHRNDLPGFIEALKVADYKQDYPRKSVIY